MKHIIWALAVAVLSSVLSFAQDQAPATGSPSAPTTSQTQTGKKKHSRKRHRHHHSTKKQTV